MKDSDRIFFWEKVQKNDCWIWTAAKNEKGYGIFCIEGRTYKAHRLSYLLSVGAIPEGMCVLHKCDVPSCVNPDHLFIGTRADNNADMLAKGRKVPGGKYCGKNGNYPRGMDHHNARLSFNEIQLIRQHRKDGWSFGRISKEHKISIGYAFRLINETVRRDK